MESDPLLQTISDYVHDATFSSEEAYITARACLADALGCAILALNYPECTKLLGPVVPGTQVPNGARVPGTGFVLDPLRAAFNMGSMIRWLDYNDTWLAAEWGHPSDNLGGLIAISDYLNRSGLHRLTVRDLLTAMIKAYEIQGILALKNSFNKLGLDHVLLVKIATAAVSIHLMGGTKSQIADSISQCFVDAGPLRTYRHAPNVGSRKSWAAGDATSRGLQFAWMTKQGEMGYKQPLNAKHWGFNDVILKGSSLLLERPLGSYVMENILFKVNFPAEFHAQTALEAAIMLHPQLKGRWEEIADILIETHESALRIIDKKGKLHNPADRDHCIQYIIAIGLLFGTLKADHYEEEIAQDPRIDLLRSKMRVVEKEEYSRDYLHPGKRSIASALTVTFNDGSKLPRLAIEYPLGHRQRRIDGLPLIYEKFRENLMTRLPIERVNDLLALWEHPDELDRLLVDQLMNFFTQ